MLLQTLLLHVSALDADDPPRYLLLSDTDNATAVAEQKELLAQVAWTDEPLIPLPPGGVAAVPRNFDGLPKTDKVKLSGRSAEGHFRLDHALQIQADRMEWVRKHPFTYVNLLRAANFSDTDIQMMIERRKGLDFLTEADWHACVADLKQATEAITARTAGRVHDWVAVHQGSSVTGFSTNPQKGLNRSVPVYFYGPDSDTDFRVTAQGISGEVIRLQRTGVNFTHRNGPAAHVLKPADTAKLFPELTVFQQKWAPLVRYCHKDDCILQVTVVDDPNDPTMPARTWDEPVFFTDTDTSDGHASGHKSEVKMPVAGRLLSLAGQWLSSVLWGQGEGGGHGNSLRHAQRR